MKKRVVERSAAMLMAILVISIPMFSSLALANGIKSVEIYGEDGTPGFYRESDSSITYDVVAEWIGNAITPDNVGIQYQGLFYPFSESYCQSKECTKLEFSPVYGGESYRCKCTTYPLETATSVTAKLVDSSGNSLATGTGHVTPEVLPPTVTLHSVRQEGAQAIATYSATDKACDSCGAVCAGVGRVVLSADGDVVDEITEGFAGCSTGQKEIAFSLTGDQEREICVQAYDNMYRGVGDVHHESDLVCTKFTGDFSTPQVCPDGKFYVTKNGNRLEWISSTGANSLFTADVEVEIIDSSPLIVQGDLSSLNDNARYRDPGYPHNYLALPCSAYSVNTCKFSNLELHITGTSPTITITATDPEGNSDGNSCVGQFQIDNNPPEFRYIKTDKCKDDKCYVNEGGNKILVGLSDVGAGFYTEMIHLDISKLNSAFAGMRAQVASCSNTGGNNWECYGMVDVQRLSTPTPRVSIVQPSHDDAGNIVSGSENLYYDNTPPIYHTIDIYPADDNDKDYFEVGDDVIIVANISDSSGVTAAWADLENVLGEGYDEVYADCRESENDHYTCEWTLREIIGPISNGPLLFYANDTAGNVPANPTIETITVLALEGVAYDYWKLGKIIVMPKSIDKATTEYAQQFALVSIELIPLLAGAETLAMDLDCINMETQDLQGAPQLLNDQRNSTNPFIRLDLRKKQIEVDELPIDCDLEIISRRGTSISQPQTLNINATLKFYNLPFGELPQNIQAEIDGVKESKLVSGKVIPKLRDAFDIMNKLCNLQKLVQKVVLLLDGIWNPLSLLEPIPIIGKPLAEIMRPPSMAGSGAASVITKAFEWMCVVVTCQLPTKLASTVGVGTGTAQFYQNVVFKNPEKSLISSVATLCIPGIINNLEKARQAECEYALCLQDQFTQYGTPPVVCSMKRQYDWCVIKGEQWLGLPFIQLINSLFEMIKGIFTNLGSLIFTLASLTCKYIPSAIGADACAIVNDVIAISETLSYILNFPSSWSNDGPNYCAELGVE